jgi:small subunit ribosomal protein S20
MPNIKSAIKRVKVIDKKTAENNMIKTGYKTAVKKVENATSKKDAENLLVEATKKIDQACTKGVLKKNTASRKKSNLAKKVNAIKK